MWEWVYSATNIQGGITVVEIKTANHRVPGQEKEWLKAQIEVETHPRRSERAMRLDALRKLQTLIDGEIGRLEHLLAGGGR
jgi:hypothetical protein